MIKVSIIIPAFNVGKYIEECLESVISQTLRNIEIIIVNDGSNDNTQEIINRYSEKDLRIKVISQKNKGISNARNTGAAIARGEYIYFMDSDDFIDIDSMEILYELASEHGCDMIYGDKVNFKEGTLNYKDVLKKRKDDKNRYDFLYYDNARKFILSSNYQIMVWRYLIKRDLWENLNFSFYENIYYEDCEFTNKCIFKASKIGYVNHAFYYYRQRRGSFVHSEMTKHKAKSALVVAESLYCFYDNNISNEDKRVYSTIISPDILRAVSSANYYKKISNESFEDRIRPMIFHLKNSLSRKHRIIAVIIGLNFKFVSAFLFYRYKLARAREFYKK